VKDKKQLYAITKPFPQKFIREAGKGRYFVPHAVLRQRLLQVVGNYDWKSGPEIIADGNFVGIYGQLDCIIDGQSYSVRCIGSASATEDDGDKLKAAESDAFRRCAMQLGLGLHLWTNSGEWFLSLDNESEDWKPNHIPIKKLSETEPTKVKSSDE